MDKRPRKLPECDPTTWIAMSIFGSTDHPRIHEEELWIAIDSLSQYSPKSRADLADVLRGRAAGETFSELGRRFGVSSHMVVNQESRALRILRSRVKRFAHMTAFYRKHRVAS